MEALMSSGSSKLGFLLTFLTLSTFLFHVSLSATLVVDGVSHWNNPTVQVGDSIIFRHKLYDDSYKLYIFQNRRAFNTCNFTQSTLLSKPNSTSFTWHPSRLGFFYFSFNNGSTKACQDGQKLAIEVASSMPPEISAPSPELEPPAESPQSPPPTLGGIVSSSPAYPWPFGPRESTAPSPSPDSEMFPATSPSMVPIKGGGAIPFINSNPAVPLPTGEVDSATIRPVPTSSDHRVQVVGFQAVLRTVFCVVFMMLV